MNTKFEMYEIVKVVKKIKKFESLYGKTGIIISIQKQANLDCGYLVSFSKSNCCMQEDEIESTGKFSAYENIFTGETIKVGMKPDGMGYLKD